MVRPEVSLVALPGRSWPILSPWSSAPCRSGARYAQQNELGYLIFAMSFSTVGVAVAWHRPSNPIGWLFGVIGVPGAAALVGNGHAELAVIDRAGALPGGTWAALLAV